MLYHVCSWQMKKLILKKLRMNLPLSLELLYRLLYYVQVCGVYLGPRGFD